ncbi:MAG: L,D-transpeptidase family protein [Hyphomicrobiales bacterium]|nr:L,D-transpeptidase family protein [Hyphomicrobiales bacterium]
MGAADALTAGAGAADLAAFLDRLAPADPAYADLRAALARYRAVAAGGEWPTLPDGPLLRPGAADARLPALRRRLAATGDLPATVDPAGGVYAPGLAAAVRRFQGRHGLAADGIVGPATRAALNLPAAQRVAILADNLRRLRGHLRRVAPTAVVVNVAAADLRVMVDGVQVLRSRVIVGREDWATPLFQGAITALEFHPAWYVPPRIVRLEMLQQIRRDPDYLARHNLQVIDGWGDTARIIDPATIDWRAGRAGTLRLRQPPGPRNPLGRVKFLFENPHQVYLHDTPRTDLFDQAKRMLSHGCVRVELAAELATVLLAPDPAWPPQAVAAALESGQTRYVRLARPMPLYLISLTAWAEPDGTVHFRPHGGDQVECSGAPEGPLPAKGSG